MTKRTSANEPSRKLHAGFVIHHSSFINHHSSIINDQSPDSELITIHVANEQGALAVDETRLGEAVRMILDDASLAEAQISLAVVDDPTIHRLNRRYLNHDHPTDVLSFVLERAGQKLEGEVVVSAQTARRTAPQFGWSAADELLLYVIHGTLHLVGYDDQTPEARAKMRARERAYLARFGLEPRFDEQDADDRVPAAADPPAQLPEESQSRES